MTNVGIELLSYFKAQGRLAVGEYPSVNPPPTQKTVSIVAGILKTSIPISLWTYDERPLAASASEELVLNDGSMLDQFGAGVTYATLKYIVVTFLTGGVGIRVGQAATFPHLLWLQGTTPAQDVLLDGPPLQQGGSVGKVVNAGANRIKIANLDTVDPCTYSIFCAGV